MERETISSAPQLSSEHIAWDTRMFISCLCLSAESTPSGGVHCKRLALRPASAAAQGTPRAVAASKHNEASARCADIRENASSGPGRCCMGSEPA